MSEMIISRTPLRITFLGGGTDLDPYRGEKGGICTAATIDKYVTIIVADNFERKIRASYSATEIVDHSDEVRHPLVLNAIKLLRIEDMMEQQKKGIEILSKSDIPSKGTGMGSSSSFTVGLLNALHVWKDSRMVSERQLAEEAVQVETRSALEDSIVRSTQSSLRQNSVNSINDIALGLEEKRKALKERIAVLDSFLDAASKAKRDAQQTGTGEATIMMDMSEGTALLKTLKDERVETGINKSVYQAIGVEVLKTTESKDIKSQGVNRIQVVCKSGELDGRITELNALRARLSGCLDDTVASLRRLDGAYDGKVGDHEFTVTLLRELYLLKEGVMMPAAQLDKKADEVESNISVGRQDQYIAAYGGMQLMEFMPGNKTIMTQIPLALQEMKRLKEHFLLLYTGVQRNASEQLVAQSKGARSKYQLYDEMKTLAYEFAGELKNGIWKNLGTFLDDGWQIKRRLSNGISSAAIDDMYDRAKKSGAVGAKLLGAGGGGFLLVFAPPETHDAILKSLPELRPVNFNMTIEGSKVRVLHEGGV